MMKFLLVGSLLLFPSASAAAGSVVFFGDSITAGYGVEPEEAYPALIRRKIEERKWNFPVVAAGVSGDTTSAALGRLKWSLSGDVAVVVIALGGNDGLRGVPAEATKANLGKIIDGARALHPRADILLAGMKMPPNYGAAFTERYAKIFPDLAREKKVTLIPFLLEKVGGEVRYNQPDRIHPTPEGHAIIAGTIWRSLEPVLRKRT